MVLVRPDMVQSAGNNTISSPGNAQAAYYDTQVAKEKLSPHASLIGVLVHLQKQANAVLHDPSLKSSAKLMQYNQLMTRSSILMKKAKSTVKLEDSFVPYSSPTSALSRPTSGSPSVITQEDSDDDEVDQWDDALSDTSVISSEQQSVERATPIVRPNRASEEGMDAEIKDRIPRSYQQQARKLYKLLVTQGKGKLNWDQHGQLVIGNKALPGSDIIELLADAARPKTKGKVPVGRALFTKIVKRLNPRLRHVKNKRAFNTSLANLSREKRASPQKGSGRKQSVIWHTKL